MCIRDRRNTSCGVLAENFSNQSPRYKIPPQSLNYTIPTGTPFLLGYNIEVDDEDNEETQLLYSWEQMDGEKTLSPPVNTSQVGPMFRSIFPNNEIVRSFPDIETVANGDVQNTWEVIPQLSRQMNFTFTVRDDNDGGGRVVIEKNVGGSTILTETKTEAEKTADAKADAEYDARKTKRKGRRMTILTSQSGARGNLVLGKPTLLGA